MRRARTTPYADTRQHKRRAVFQAASAMSAAAALLLLGACALQPSSASPGETATATTTIADADVLTGDALHNYTGPSSAVLASTAPDPVSDDPQPQLPVTVTDRQGTEVTITDTSRILALDIYGSLSRIVFDLGLGGNLVGRDTSSGYPEIADLPLVTQNGHEVNAEAILALEPTVILTDTTIGPWDVFLQMRDAGIPVVVLDSHRTIDTIGELTQSVADALGVPTEGAELAARTIERTDAVIADIAAVAPADDSEKLRTVFLYVRGQAGIYYLFGADSGADALISAVGGLDVASQQGWTGMRPVTDEAIIAAQPEVIIMMTKGLESVGGIDGLLERVPAIAMTPAGVSRRIVDVPDTEVLAFGPITPAVLDAVARAIYAPAENPQRELAVDQ